MSAPSSTASVIARIARGVLLLTVVLTLVVAAGIAWAWVSHRGIEADRRTEITIPAEGGTVPLDAGHERVLSVDTPDVREVRCTVTAGDGSTEELRGHWDQNYGGLSRGVHIIDRLTADERTAGDHEIRCTGADRTWVAEQVSTEARERLAIAGYAALLWATMVLPVLVLSLVVWLVARGRARRA